MLPTHNEVIQFGSLELIAKQVVEGFITGLHKSPYHGFSVEFAEHLRYNPGESTKNIDWKLFARTDKLYTKQFEEETNLRCQILLDLSSSMWFPKDDKNNWNKKDYSILAISSLIELLRKQRDAVGLTTFDQGVLTQIPSKTGGAHFNQIYAELQQQLDSIESNSVANETRVHSVLHEIAEQINKRSLVVVFTDFIENKDGELMPVQDLIVALQHLKHHHHEIIIFHVTRPDLELNFEFDNRPYKFIDLETKEELKVEGNKLKELYQNKMNAYFEELKNQCGDMGVDFVEVDIKETLFNVLTAFLLKRQKLY